MRHDHPPSPHCCPARRAGLPLRAPGARRAARGHRVQRAAVDGYRRPSSSPPSPSARSGWRTRRPPSTSSPRRTCTAPASPRSPMRCAWRRASRSRRSTRIAGRSASAASMARSPTRSSCWSTGARSIRRCMAAPTGTTSSCRSRRSTISRSSAARRLDLGGERHQRRHQHHHQAHLDDAGELRFRGRRHARAGRYGAAARRQDFRRHLLPHLRQLLPARRQPGPLRQRQFRPLLARARRLPRRFGPQRRQQLLPLRQRYNGNEDETETLTQRTFPFSTTSNNTDNSYGGDVLARWTTSSPPARAARCRPISTIIRGWRKSPTSTSPPSTSTGSTTGRPPSATISAGG